MEQKIEQSIEDYKKVPEYAKRERMQELAVITYGRKLCEYIYTITQNSPKKFRWSLVAKLQESSYDYVQKLYYANELPVRARMITLLEAQSILKMLDFSSQMSKTTGAITHKQFNHISKLLYDCRVTLRGWAKSINQTPLKTEEKQGKITNEGQN